MLHRTSTRKRAGIRLAFAIMVVGVLASPGFADDWPAYQHDDQRSGVTAERLGPPLAPAWTFAPRQAPAPAWPPPARDDLWHHEADLRPRMTFDRAFHVAAVGDTVCFASSADDQAYALDAATGAVRWRFFTNGPVRFAPTIANGSVYVGSDDGTVYCLDATDGSLRWQYTASNATRAIMGNGRLISQCPVRTGVVVRDGTAYFCAGLFPPEGVYLCALDAETGAEKWVSTPGDLSPQGYLLASASRLYVPTGRATPAVFDRGNGEHLYTLAGSGGAYALLAGDSLTYGGARRELSLSGKAAADQLFAFQGNRMLVTPSVSFLHSKDELAALDRDRYVALASQRAALKARIDEGTERLGALERDSEDAQRLRDEIRELKKQASQAGRDMNACFAWERPHPFPYALILAGDVLYAGGDGAVAALGTVDGDTLWTAGVDGKAYGLAVANGRLFVSTDKGRIHCFTATGAAQPAATSPSAAAFPENESAAACAEAAQRIVDATGVRQGLCLVLGIETGRLAYELAERTELQVVCLEDDPAKVRAAREALAAAGMYGGRVAVRSGALGTLPCTDYVANLVVSERALLGGDLPTSADEAYRVLRPGGGVAWLGGPDADAGGTRDRAALDSWLDEATRGDWQRRTDGGVWTVCRRGPLEGEGLWTHQYADLGNTACSGDTLVQGPMRVQWFGEPGPRPMLDRHHRNVAPLARDGRVFVTGDDQVIAVDAYNGTALWRTDLPNTRRLGAQRDASSRAVAPDRVYIAVDQTCWALDVATGARDRAFAVPQIVEGVTLDWGYVATLDDRLFGSGQQPGARYTMTSWAADKEIQWGDFMRQITSRSLFCMDRHGGDVLWTYANGAILNPSLAVGGGRLYCIESHAPDALADDGRVSLEVLFATGPHLVALDAHTGETVYDRPIDLTGITHIVYLSFADGLLAITGSGNLHGRAWYFLIGIDAATGDVLWRADHGNSKDGIDGDHGEQIHHPVIVGDTIYAEPAAYNLKTGARVNPQGQPEAWEMAARGGCGTMSASADYLFFRDGNPVMESLRVVGERIPLGRVSRPGCWINILPVGGLVVIPEASSGCTCNFSIQTSLAFIPEKPG